MTNNNISMEGLKIRHACKDDLADIVKIYNSTISSRMVTADTNPVTTESRVAWFNDHNDTTRPLWIVQDKDMIIGWLSFQSFYGRPAYSSTIEISIYLDQDFRGRGIGRQLLKYSMLKSREMAINTIIGFIFSHNTPSIELFKSEGFEQWGHLPDIAVLDGNEVSVNIFGKKLDP